MGGRSVYRTGTFLCKAKSVAKGLVDRGSMRCAWGPDGQKRINNMSKLSFLNPQNCRQKHVDSTSAHKKHCRLPTYGTLFPGSYCKYIEREKRPRQVHQPRRKLTGTRILQQAAASHQIMPLSCNTATPKSQKANTAHRLLSSVI